jgi:MerR family transcriptional regulator, copper efflux regulator
MTTKHPLTAPNGGAEPVACALTRDGLAAQRARWQRLAAGALTERADTIDGVRFAFRPGHSVEAELRALVATEQECCPWAEWTVEVTGQQVVLGVRAAGTGADALHEMFTGLRPATA